MNTLLRKPIKSLPQTIRLVFAVLYTSILYGQNQCDITISGNANGGGSFIGTTFVPTASSVNINTTTLISKLVAGDVTINTFFGGGTGSGNITFSDPISAAKTATSTTTFTIVAGGTLTVNAMNLKPTDNALSSGRDAVSLNFTAVSNISITGAISTIGGNSLVGNAGNGGAVSLTSTGGSINIGSSIDVSGGSGVLVAGNGANITISAAGGITLSNNLTSIAGTGATGGAVGNFSVTNGATTVTTGGGTNDGQTAGVISGGTFTKSGAGTLILSGTNTYTGTTTISGGNLVASATVVASTNGALGNHVSGLILNGGTVSSNTPTFSRTITVSANGSGIDAYGSARTISSLITVTGPFSLNIGGTTVASAEGQSLTLSNSISSSGALTLTKIGSSTLTLSGTNTYTGGTTLSAGTLIVGNSQAFGTSAGTFTITGGSLDASSSITTLNYPLALNGDFTFTGTNSLNLGTGTITMNGDRTITISGSTLTIGGALSETTRSFIKAGTGTLHFGATAKSFNSLTISAGTLISTSNTLTLAGNFTNNGIFTHNSGSVIMAGTTQNVSGTTNPIPLNTFTINNGSTTTLSQNISCVSDLNINSGAILDLSTQTANRTATGGTLTINGTLQLSGTSGGQTGSNFPINFSSLVLTNSSIHYSKTNGGQTIYPVTYNNLSINNTSGTQTIGSSLSIGATLSFANSGTGTLTLGSNTLTLSGAIANSTSARCFVANGSSGIVINGSGSLVSNIFLDQTTPGTTNRLDNLIYNRSSETITLGDTVEIKGAVIPTAGTLATGDKLKLISTVSGTARVAQGSGTYISGNVIVERFIPATARRWRFFGSAVSGTTLNDLKNEIYITGAGGASNGFDATLSNQASVYTYDETILTGDLNTGFAAATHINNPLIVGKGYRLFIRGDRSNPGRLDGTVTTQNAVTLNLSGPLNTGDITMPVSFTSSGNAGNDGWSFVGNPYASAYNWKAFWDAQKNTANCTNIDPTIYILDATSNSYISYNANSDAGTLTAGIIPSAAGFWVKATAASPTLVLSETYKTATLPIGVFKTTENEGFKIRLEADSISYDELVIKYMAGASANRDSLDIFKLASTLVNICAYGSDTQYLSASVRPLTTTADTIRLGVYASAAGNYTLRFYNSQQIAIHENVLLYDTYTSTVTDLTAVSEYAFAVTAGVAASQGDSRFYIVVTNNTGLPVNLLSFEASKQDDQTVRLNWTTTEEIHHDHFEIERSHNGDYFSKIGELKRAETNQKRIQYTFTDHNPLAENYYRLKQVDKDGMFVYSQIVYVGSVPFESKLELFPVPAGNELFIKQPHAIKTVRIFDLSGILKFLSPTNSTFTPLNLQTLETGIYIIEIENINGSISRAKFSKL